MTKINICTISTDEGRMTIYWDTEDHMLHCLETEDYAGPEYKYSTLEEAVDAAQHLWGWGGGWDLEWIENEEE